MYVFIVLMMFGIAAHLVYDMFSWYLTVILVFPTARFVECNFFSDCAIS